MAVSTLVASAAALWVGADPRDVSNVAHMLASVSAMAAGAGLLVCWRLGGRAVPGWLGVAFVDFGLLSLAYGTLRALQGRGFAADPYGRLVPCAMAAVAIIGALRSAEVDSRLRPVRMVVTTTIGGVALLATLESLARLDASPAWAEVVTRSACGVVWLVLGLVILHARRTNAGIAVPWVLGFLTTLSFAQGLSAALGDLTISPVVADIGFLVASAVALRAASRELGWIFQRQDRHTLSLRATVEGFRCQLDTERAQLEEQLHDLRNAVAGIRNAHLTLRRYRNHLDEATCGHLADSMTTELSRLQGLIEPGRSLRIEMLDLKGVVGPLLANPVGYGIAVHADLGDHAVLGDRDALTQVMQNLLANVRRHAPGALVRISAERVGELVQVRVADEGPGIAVLDQKRIFDRGVRGSPSSGSEGQGLGLFISRRLMQEMGGNVGLEHVERGACFVVTIPAPPPGDSDSPETCRSGVLDVAALLEISLPRVRVLAGGSSDSPKAARDGAARGLG